MAEQSDAAKSFIGSMMSNKERPHDGFAQAAHLLESDSNEVTLFSQICEKQVMLANISEDEYLRLVQTDLSLLTHLFDMARRDPQIKDFFLVEYYAIKSELQLTRAKDGLEIKAQHAVASAGWKPSGNISGFGNASEINQQEKNLFAQLWDKTKRKPQQQQQQGGPQ